MITKGKLTDQILRLYTGGNPSDDKEISRADVDLLVGQVINQILKKEYVASNISQGEMFPPHTLVTTYKTEKDEDKKVFGDEEIRGIPIASKTKGIKFGNYDKLTMTKLYIEHCHGLDLENCETDFIFSGDSPNDAPMFKYFSHSVGVANVRDFDGQLDSPPAYITEGRGGAGFTEIADFLTSVRN